MTPDTYLSQLEEQAALFSVGAMPPDEARRFQRRLDAECPLCLSELEKFESAVSALTLAIPEIAPPPALRGRLMDRIASKRTDHHTVIGAGKLVRADDTEWEASTVPGVRFRRLHGEKTTLVRMDPKTVFPAHDHHGAEQCLVLEGDVQSDGVTAYAGDFTYMPAGSKHDPLYTEGGCLLLVAYT
jgi:hypothetical protein